MRLNTRAWGSGDRVAVLIHGLMGDSRQYWRVGPVLADLGFRAISVDLPGHGLSPADAKADIASSAEALAASVPAEPELIIGQSIGGRVAAQSLPLIRPAQAIYVDASVSVPGAKASPTDPADPEKASARRAELFEAWTRARTERTVENLRVRRPAWHESDREAEQASARLFDVPTGVSLLMDLEGNPPPPSDPDVRSLMIFADPGGQGSVDRQREAVELRRGGIDVETVAGSGHGVWYSHFDEFMRVVEDWVD